MRDQSGPRRKNTVAVSGFNANKLPAEAESFEVAKSTFIRRCKIKNLSGQTIIYYRDVLGRLRSEMEKVDDEGPIDVTHDHIHDFMLETREVGSTDATVDKYIRGWRAYFNLIAT